MKNFDCFELAVPLKKSLEVMGFREPTPIQSESLPLTLSGEDLIGCAQTGSGKTAAFCLPLIDHLLKVRQKSALILAPTRELVLQIGQTLNALTSHCPQLRSAELIGGEPMSRQLKKLSSRPRPQVWIATPGRLLDLARRGAVKLQYVSFLVLDEADRMLDMGFAEQLKQIAAQLPQRQNRQTLMFSATMPREVEKLTGRFLDRPSRVMIGKVTGETGHVQQSTVYVSQQNKWDRLLDELNQKQGSILVFVASKHRTDRLTRYLKEFGLSVSHIHGGRTQGQRKQALNAFRNGRSRILVATDIAARGLDIPKIETVINFDLPRAPDDYTHRIGRTARAGASGESVTFILPEDKQHWLKISRHCKLSSKLSKDLVSANWGEQKKPRTKVEREFRRKKKKLESRGPSSKFSPRRRRKKKGTGKSMKIEGRRSR